MSYGFVYFLVNPSMPGLTKIGFTHKHPRTRMDELTKATACPTPFEMLAFFDTATPREAEQAIHESLCDYRVNAGREFFDAPAFLMQDRARDWCNLDEGICFFGPLDELVVQQDREHEAALDAILVGGATR